MHTIRTVIPAAARPSTRSTGSTSAEGAIESVGRGGARLLSAWAGRHLLGAPAAGQTPATPHRELPLPWA